MGEASVADTKTCNDDFLLAEEAMRRCLRPREGFQPGQLVSLRDLFLSVSDTSEL